MEWEKFKDLVADNVNQYPQNTSAFALRENQSYDPFHQIKKRCRWIFVCFGGATIIFFPVLGEKNNILLVILYFILSVESFIALTGYLQIRAIEQDLGSVKQNLLNRIRRLKSIFNSYIYLNAGFYILLAIVLEYMIRSQSLPGFEKMVFPLRFIFYVLFIGFQVFQKRWSFQKNYGSYLSSMIRLLNQTHED